MDFAVFQEIFQKIRWAERLLLLTDERVDGDTVGSTLAVAIWLSRDGKEVQVFSPTPVPETFGFLPGIELIQNTPKVFEKVYDLVLIFDCSDGTYVRQRLPQLPGSPPVVVFDHHRTNSRYGAMNLVMEDASSTGEVVWQFFKHQRVEITRPMAENLLAAICYDTTHFTNDATTHVCLQAASELGMKGAKLHRIVREFYVDKSIPALKLWGVALERLQAWPGSVIVTCVTQDDLRRTGSSEEDLEGIANFLIALVQGAFLIGVLRETSLGGVKVSLRTIEGDVTPLAQRFGGGGHTKAAGFAIPDARLECRAGEWILRQAGRGNRRVADLFALS
jgi:phosphoesterase RecJ-like protein